MVDVFFKYLPKHKNLRKDSFAISKVNSRLTGFFRTMNLRCYLVEGLNSFLGAWARSPPSSASVPSFVGSHTPCVRKC
jgi:hypothetical protein